MKVEVVVLKPIQAGMRNKLSSLLGLIGWDNHYASYRLEPIMLKNLPIIPSRTSQNFYPLFLIYSQIITYHWKNFHIS